MSFEIVNFSPIGGQARSGNSPAHWSYESDVDDLPAAQAPGYFDKVGTQVSPGDFINVSLADGKAILTVDSIVLSPPGVVIDAAIIGSGSGGGGSFPVVEVVLASLQLVVSDNLTYFVMLAATQQTVIIPENASEPFPIGAEIIIQSEGIGGVMFLTLGAAVLQSRDGLIDIGAQYSAAALKKIDTDEWRLIGDLA